MPLKIFPIRPQIYEPVRMLGVNDGDWPFVIGLTLSSFIFPFLLGYVLVAFFAWIGVAGGSIAFFNWARMGRRPLWLWFKLRSLIESAVSGRTLGCDHRKREEQVAWILDAEDHEDLMPILYLEYEPAA